MSLFFKSPVDIEILLDGEENRKHVEIPTSSSAKVLTESLPVYEDGETISGVVTLRVGSGRDVEHLGVKISVIGSIDIGKSASNNGSRAADSHKNPIDQFLCLSYDLCPIGKLNSTQSFPFEFKNVSKRYESYRGKNVDVSYYVKVSVARKSTDISKSKKLWVQLYTESDARIPEEEGGGGRDKLGNKPVKLDIGIENCLHIEFEYSKSIYSLKDVIVGRIYFLLSRLKVKHMELSLLTRETSGMPQASHTVDSTSIRYEIMDGSPVKGETIPIRLFLSGYELTPNMSCNYFNVRNYLSLVIVDEDGRRYFKQSEVRLYRSH